MVHLIRSVFYGACLLAIATLSGAGIHVVFEPDTTITDPSETFTVYLWIAEAGSEFSGYEAVIRFDPTAVEFVSAAQESLMWDVCQNTWWQTQAGPDSIFISHVLLCGGQTVTGPGALSSLTLQAREIETTTEIRFDTIEFYRAGYPVEPVESRNGTVIIGGSSGAGESQGENQLRFDLYPNPVTREARFRWVLPHAVSGELKIFDCAGRLVAQPMQRLNLAAGEHSLSWIPIRGESPPTRGVYYCRLRVGDETLTRSLILDF